MRIRPGPPPVQRVFATAGMADALPFEVDHSGLFTDGVTEAHRPRRELFGEQRLAAALREPAGSHPGAVVRRLLSELRAHAGDVLGDDVCIVAARVQTA